MPNDTTTTKSPQEIKAENIRAEIEQLTGITFQGPGGMAFANAMHNAKRTGARPVDPDKEDSPLECCHEWHFVQFHGTGKNLVPLLYGISLRISYQSGCFHASLTKIAKFLEVKREDILAAANLLLTSGFWEKIEAEIGKPVKYRPIGHKEWAEKHPGRCTKKGELPFTQDDEQLALLGRNLHAIMGGETFVPNVLKGIRNAANGLTDEEIKEQAKLFMAGDGGKGSGKERRKRLIEYLRGLENETP